MAFLIVVNVGSLLCIFICRVVEISNSCSRGNLAVCCSLLRTDGDHIRVEERRGHAQEVAKPDDSKRLSDPESDNRVPDQVLLAR